MIPGSFGAYAAKPARDHGGSRARRRLVDEADGDGLLLIQETEKKFQDTENMSDHLLPYLANCSLLFTEEPLLRRPAAARAAGFGAVEFWWPFAVPVPSDREVDAFTAAIEEGGVTLAGLNFFAGDLAGPDCGVLSIPGRSAEFRDNIDVVAGIGERLGVRGFNALYGNRVDGTDPAAQDELAAESIGLAAKAVAAFGGTVLIEPVSGPKPYPLRTAAGAVDVVRRARAAGAANVGFLCDLYHLASNGDDLDAAIAAYADYVAHVQIADAPGRGEPGSGQLDLDRYLAALAGRGYKGWVSLEYKPTSTTEASLAWLPRERRAVPASQRGAAPAGQFLSPRSHPEGEERGTSERATREGGAS
jgi:hydroxypyruvate isomerase